MRLYWLYCPTLQSDVIIFGGQVGVYCNGGANLIEGVHTWYARHTTV